MELISAQEAATIMGIPLRTVQRRCKAGILPGKRLGAKNWVLPRRTVESIAAGRAASGLVLIQAHCRAARAATAEFAAVPPE